VSEPTIDLDGDESSVPEADPVIVDDEPDEDGIDAIDDPEGGPVPATLPDAEGIPDDAGDVALDIVDDVEAVDPPDGWVDDCDGDEHQTQPLGFAAFVGGGFPASGIPKTIGIKTYRVPDIDTKISLALRSDVAPILLYVAQQFHRRVERLHPGWNWGYAYRPVRGSSRPSFHAAGVAIDLNAPRHPLGSSPRRTFTARQRMQIAAILREVGGTVRWGGNYAGRKDPMHFEVTASPARARTVAKRLAGKATIRPVPSAGVRSVRPVALTRVLRWRRLRPLMRGADVAAVQRIAGVPRADRDGRYGRQSVAYVKAYQHRKGLAVDGRVGQATARAMGLPWRG
jgi:hypothetical protein